MNIECADEMVTCLGENLPFLYTMLKCCNARVLSRYGQQRSVQSMPVLRALDKTKRTFICIYYIAFCGDGDGMCRRFLKTPVNYIGQIEKKNYVRTKTF